MISFTQHYYTLELERDLGYLMLSILFTVRMVCVMLTGPDWD